MQQSASYQLSDGSRLCLLSLDGGGVRGLSSLLVLRQLMERINPDHPPKPCEFFDMIGGTSTGGLIAIMLGRLEMNIDECLAAYEKISRDAFTTEHLSPVDTQGQIRPHFDAAALEASIKSMIESRGLNPSKALLKNPGGNCKTFVCAIGKEHNDTVVLSTYCHSRASTQLYHRTLIWQAARATMATTALFDDIEFSDITFVNGATGAGNPIYKLWAEANGQWNKNPSSSLGDQVESLVSVGTGKPCSSPFADGLVEVGKTLRNLTLECEKTAEQFRRDRAELADSNRLFRFNVKHGLEDIGLEEAAKCKEIMAATRTYAERPEIRRTLDLCAATLKQRHVASLIESLTAKAAEILDPLIRGHASVQKTTNVTQPEKHWLASSPEYLEWRNSNASCYLALLAETGHGKTRFLHYLIGDFIGGLGNSLDTLVTYIPCREIKPSANLLLDPFRRRNTGQVQSGLRNVQTVQEDDNEGGPEQHYNDHRRGTIQTTIPTINSPSATLPEHTNRDGINVSTVTDPKENSMVGSGHDIQRLSHVTVFRTILFELLYQKGCGIDYLKRKLRVHGSDLRSLSLQDLLERNDQVAADSLHYLIQATVREFQIQNVVLVIDELEQLMHHDRLELIHMLNTLPVALHQSRTIFRVLIAGTPEVNLSGKLDGYVMIDSQAELDACLRSLHFKEMYMRRDRVASSTKGTNLWIWKHRAFRDWMNTSSGILWIEGKAGCGKSTLAKEIQNHLHQNNLKLPKNAPKTTITGFQSPVITDHFYSARQLETGVSHELMLRSTIYQILQSDESLFRHLQAYYRSIQSEINKSGQWSWDQLERILEILKNVKGPTQNIICIIDAMDESKQDELNERHRTRVLRLLRNLCMTRRTEISVETSKLNFKFIVLSRPAREIARELQHCQRIQMHVENKGDIRLLIDQGLRNLQGLMKQDDLTVDKDWDDAMDRSSSGHSLELSLDHQNAELAEKRAISDIRTHLIERASGVTLWVLLTIGQLRRLVDKGLYSFLQLYEELKRLPEHLLTLYQNIASGLQEKLDRPELERAKALLLWVSFASRPLQLAELWEATAIPLSDPVSSFDQLISMRVHMRDSHQLWLGMLELCGPFIDLVHDNTLTRQAESSIRPRAKENDTVQLLHQSVKEFFTKHEAGPFRILPEDVTKLEHACWTYANIAFPIDGYSVGKKGDHWNDQDHTRLVSELNKRPLLLYAIQNATHEQSLTKSQALLESFFRKPQVIALFSDVLGFSKLFRFQVSEGESKAIIGLYRLYRTRWFILGCQLKAENAVRLLLYLLHSPGHGELEHDVSEVLVKAVESKDYRLVELIRKHPMFDFDHREGPPSGSMFSLLEEPLHSAIKGNDLQMVKCLIQGLRGRLYFQDFPLHVAAAYAGVELTEYIIWKTVAVDTLNQSREAPMDIALKRRWDPMVKLLRSMGAKTAFEQAASKNKQAKHRALWMKTENASGRMLGLDLTRED